MRQQLSSYRQFQGFGLATAEILYRMPDHQAILQTYIWQEYDFAPHFPQLQKFLDFWIHHLDGPLHTVRVAHRELLKPGEITTCESEW